MTKTKSLSIALSREELYVILAYLKTNKLVGLDDDADNLSKINANGALEIAEKGLLARGFLQPEANGQLKLIPPIFATVGTCIFPETSLLITRIASSGYKQEFYFHTYRKMLVTHTIPLTDIHQFTAVEEKKMALSAINSFLKYDKVNLQKYSPGIINLDELLIIRDVALEKDGGDAFRLLVDTGLNKDTAQAFAQTLSKPLVNTNLAYVAKAGELTEGFTILEGHNHLWLLNPNDDNYKQVKLSLTSPDEIYNKVKRLIDL